MLNNVLKIAFGAVGIVTGLTLTKTFILTHDVELAIELKVAIFGIISLITAYLFYSTSNKIIDAIQESLDRLEMFIQRTTLYELLIISLGLIAGLIVANLITIPVNKLEIIGIPISISANLFFGCIGIGIAMGKRNDSFIDAIKPSQGSSKKSSMAQPKVLDTSVIIDGRILDICQSGFLEGELIIPSFVLEELRHIADSSDVLKRNKGRRGLDVLNAIQKEVQYPVRIENVEMPDGAEVDSELIKLAKKLQGKVLTTDYNLNKVASFQGVPVMNVNQLANAVKPIALPGEEMVVQIIKDGKENGQGIGYMEDGTMIVVEEGRRYIGESINVMVTSTFQTAAGRMIFAKPKCSIERVI